MGGGNASSRYTTNKSTAAKITQGLPQYKYNYVENWRILKNEKLRMWLLYSTKKRVRKDHERKPICLLTTVAILFSEWGKKLWQA